MQEEIREDSWTGSNFRYPAYRISVVNIGPYNSNGECRPFIFDVLFTVYCFAEDASSKSCAHLAGIAASNLMGKRLSSDKITPVTRIDIPANGIVMPIPEMERFWRSEVQFTTVVKSKGEA